MLYELCLNTEHCLPKQACLTRGEALTREKARKLLLPDSAGPERTRFDFAFSYRMPDLLRHPPEGTAVLLLDQQRIERNEHRFLYSCELWTRLLWVSGEQFRFLSLRSCEEDAEVWSQLFSADERTADRLRLAEGLEGVLDPVPCSELLPPESLFELLPAFL